MSCGYTNGSGSQIRMGRFTEWSDIEDARLRKLWDGDLTRREIAQTLRRTEDSVQGRATRLGLPHRAQRIQAQRYESQRRYDAAIQPIPNRDADYVALARAQGGFSAYVFVPAVRKFHDGLRMRRAYG